MTVQMHSQQIGSPTLIVPPHQEHEMPTLVSASPGTLLVAAPHQEHEEPPLVSAAPGTLLVATPRQDNEEPSLISASPGKATPVTQKQEEFGTSSSKRSSFAIKVCFMLTILLIMLLGLLMYLYYIQLYTTPSGCCNQHRKYLIYNVKTF